MTAFELSLRRMVSIYDAGVAGRSCPYYTGMRVQDIERIYTEGRLDAMAELEKAHEAGEIKIGWTMAKFIADYTTNQAAKACKR